MNPLVRTALVSAAGNGIAAALAAVPTLVIGTLAGGSQTDAIGWLSGHPIATVMWGVLTLVARDLAKADPHFRAATRAELLEAAEARQPP